MKVISIAPDNIRVCPTCGQKFSEDVGIFINLGKQEIDGVYCLHCYGRWIKNDIPKLEGIKNFN
jgi:hypothetical protein